MPDGPVPELPPPCSCARFFVRRGDILREISLIPEWVGTSPRTCFAKQLVPRLVEHHAKVTLRACFRVISFTMNGLFIARFRCCPRRRGFSSNAAGHTAG